MRRGIVRTAAACALAAVATAAAADGAAGPNQVAGTWRMVSATLERPDGTRAPAYGERPSGLLVFTPDLHYVEVLTDGALAPFASPARGGGTDAENRAAMTSAIGMFGTYTVDADGAFAGNRVEGATFPNWVGAVRTTRDLAMTVEGDTMTERFVRPDGTRVHIVFARVR
jgi:hypothetical protein